MAELKIDSMNCGDATPSTTEGNMKEATHTSSDSSTNHSDGNGDGSRLQFAVSGGDPSDFDALYSVLKWIVPLTQLGLWTCLLVLPLYSKETRLIWLWIVMGAQIITNLVGGTYQIGSRKTFFSY